MTIGREEVENPAGQNAEKPRQSKNKSLECVERLRSFTHAFRPFSHGQSRLHLGIPPIEERRRQLAVALLRWKAKSKI